MVASEFKLLGNEQDVFPDVDELFQENTFEGTRAVQRYRR